MSGVLAPDAEVPVLDSGLKPLDGAPVLALVEATERHGHVVARLPVMRWPVTVGRALQADLVLDDNHVAAQHLRLFQTVPGSVTVEVLDTRNGVTLGRQHHGRDERFEWAAGQPLNLGRLHLRLRLADTPVAAEQEMPRAPWRGGVGSLTVVFMLLCVMMAQLWLKSTETDKLLQEAPANMIVVLAALFVWAGLWALATKLFSAHAQFWRHVRIAGLAYVVANVLDFCAQVLAFAFSWESLARFAYLALVLVGAFGIYRHLLVAAPQSRRGLATGVVLALALGFPAVVGTQWLKNKRLSNQLYMAQMFPPGWRIAKPVTADQFLREAAALEQRLEKRLKDNRDADAGEDADSEEE